jgi:hypothetical protein
MASRANPCSGTIASAGSVSRCGGEIMASLTTNARGTKTQSTHYRPYGSHRDDWGIDPSDRDFTNQRLDAAAALLDYGTRRYDFLEDEYNLTLRDNVFFPKQ